MGMNVNMYAISTPVDILICTSIEDIQVVISQDSDLQRLKAYIIQGDHTLKTTYSTEYRSIGQLGMT